MAYLAVKEIVTLLHELDGTLDLPLEITICGGAAGILCHGLTRATLDIDLVVSSPALSSLAQSCRRVAENNGLAESWINDSAKGFIDYLPARRVHGSTCAGSR